MAVYARRQRPTQFTPWPFYQPGVNLVAAETPDEIERAANTYIRDRATWRDLEIALELSRNKYHRVGDMLFGLWNRNGREELQVIPAFSRLRGRS